MKLKQKNEIRKFLNIKKGGRLQLNSHGCNHSSVLVIKKGIIYEYNCKTDDLQK